MSCGFCCAWAWCCLPTDLRRVQQETEHSSTPLRCRVVSREPDLSGGTGHPIGGSALALAAAATAKDPLIAVGFRDVCLRDHKFLSNCAGWRATPQWFNHALNPASQMMDLDN